MDAATANDALREARDSLRFDGSIPLRWIVLYGQRFDVVWRSATDAAMLLGVASFVLHRKQLIPALTMSIRSMFESDSSELTDAQPILHVLGMLEHWAGSNVAILDDAVLEEGKRVGHADYDFASTADAAYALAGAVLIMRTDDPPKMLRALDRFVEAVLSRLSRPGGRPFHPARARRELAHLVRVHLPEITPEMLVDAGQRRLGL